MHRLKKIIREHEGLRLFPYKCPAGKWTIGSGRNLSDNGISYDEAMLLLENDIHRAMDELSHFDWYMRLNGVRKGVLTELNFNIGLGRFCTFKKMISALENNNYEMAAAEMLDSKWARQVGATRSNNMAYRMLRGAYAT